MLDGNYGFPKPPPILDFKGGAGGGTRVKNNNSDSARNDNHPAQPGAGASRDPHAANQFLPCTPSADGFGQFCNCGSHLPEGRIPDTRTPRRGEAPFVTERGRQPAGRDAGVSYVRPPGAPEGRADAGDGFRQLRDACRDEGPFVFGVHSPSQFRLEHWQRDDAYDYADVAEDKSVIDNESESLFCDKKINVIPGAKSENGEVKYGMFRIDDNRTKLKSKRITTAQKKDKSQRLKRGRDRIKCVLVGDGAVGKTSLITSYAQNMFQNDYKPTTFDNYNVIVEVDGRPINVELCDTAGQDSLKGLRELCYPGTDVIILCFSVVQPDTFRAIDRYWAPAVRSTKAPLVLVGTQADLRECSYTIHGLKTQCQSPVTEAEAKILASKLNAPYIETSSKKRRRLKEAFDSAILAALPIPKKKNSFLKKLFCIS